MAAEEKGKVKLVDEITLEECWQGMIDSSWGNLWTWFEVVDQEFGLEKAEEMLVKFSRALGQKMVDQWLAYFGVEEMEVPMMAQMADIIHKIIDLDARWTVLSNRSGYETIYNCTMRSSQPEKYWPRGNCKLLCASATQVLYPGLARGKAECTLRENVPAGDPHCVIAVEFK